MEFVLLVSFRDVQMKCSCLLFWMACGVMFSGCIVGQNPRIKVRDAVIPGRSPRVDVRGFVPAAYQEAVDVALGKAGNNGRQLVKALSQVPASQQEGMSFLIAHMPERDLQTLSAKFLLDNVRLAYQALKEAPWADAIPHEIFLNDILPYASINERRDNWRAGFYREFMPAASKHPTLQQATLSLNHVVFERLHVTYDGVRRPKPDQSPFESMRAHFASCTGLSVLLTDVLRAVGIPARLAGIAMWADESGNHTWVEVWDGKWHHLGASESTALDQAWFTEKAGQTDASHHIYAVSFKKTGIFFPMRWAPELRDVSAVDVTANYQSGRSGSDALKKN
ncbi:MAG: transglutaminase-like domain-containing protein [Candidatus Omnitrophota bacterium]